MANSRRTRVLDEHLSPLEMEIFQNEEFRKILTPKEYRHLESHCPENTLPSKDKRKFPFQTQHFYRFITKKQAQNAKKWHLPSGIRMIDQFFPGSYNPPQGLPSQNLTLFYGKARSGKSQICHQLPVELFKLSSIPSGKNVIFIDTESTFRPGRIQEIANSQGLSEDTILNNIISVNTPNYANFNLTMAKIPEILSKHPIRLLIIDSLTSIYRLEISNHEENINSIISNLALNLKKLTEWAQTYNMVIFLTSQVTSTFDKTYFFDVIPVLSTTLNRYIKNWILLGENAQETELSGKLGLRYAHLVNSENAPEEIIKFVISSSGVRDFYG
ncbi:MAG: hypothetical protein ACTSRK_07255 [Promethearchaeota archaeon]